MTVTELRTPPNSEESEMMVLGCMLTSTHSLKIASESLDTDDFYRREHRIVFSVVKEAYKKNLPVDIHLVAEELKRQELLSAVGGVGYLTTLAQFAGTSANIEEYASLVHDKALLRRMLEAAQIIGNIALQEPNDVPKALEHAQKCISNITVRNENRFKYLLEISSKQQTIDEIKSTSPGVPVGYRIGEIDLKIPGGALSIVALPTGHGKTATLINFSIGAIHQRSDMSVCFFSYEENASSILTLFLNTYIGKTLSKNNRESIMSYFRESTLKYMREEERESFLAGEHAFFERLIESGRLKIFYSDMSAEELVAAIRFLKEKTNVGLVCIDYMQLLKMLNGPQGRQEQLKEICLMLKNCAVDTGLPIILGAQFNRQVVAEADLSPTAIGEAGDIERIANLIVAGWNRNYAGFAREGNVSKEGKKPIPKEETIYFEILKGRGIGHGHSSVLPFNGNTGKISNQAVQCGRELGSEREIGKIKTGN